MGRCLIRPYFLLLSLRTKWSNLSLVHHNLPYVRDCFETLFLAMTSTHLCHCERSEAICLLFIITYHMSEIASRLMSLAMTETCPLSLRTKWSNPFLIQHSKIINQQSEILKKIASKLRFSQWLHQQSSRKIKEWKI